MSLNKSTKTKIKIGFSFFIFLFIFFIFQKIFNFEDYNPTVIIEDNQFNKITKNDLLIGDSVSGEFTAKHNNLGIISAKFNTHLRINNDYLQFSIKEKGQKDWYYSNKYKADQFQNNKYFPFGFPQINNSKGKVFEIDIRSVSGTITDSVSIIPGSHFLSKFSFSKAYLLQNKKEIPSFLFFKIISFVNHLNSIDLLLILGITLTLIKFLFSKYSKPALEYIFSKNIQSKYINPQQKLFLFFILSSLFVILLSTFVILFKKHTESNEWIIYEISSLGVFFGSIIFYYFSPKIRYKIFKNIAIVSFLIFLISTISLWFIFGLISFKYIFIILGLSLISPIVYFRKNIPFFLISYVLNIFLVSNIIYFFVMDVDCYKNLFFILVGLVILLFFIFKKYDFIKSHSTRNRFFTAIFIITVISLICFFKRDIEYHHYSFYLGPAYEILQGKSILNYFPSQYGYLSIHFVSAILRIVGASFMSFHLFNLVSFIFYFLGFSLIYFKLTKNSLLIILLSIITAFFQGIFSIYSSYLPPSSGMLRFGPCLLLIISVIYLPKKYKIPASAIISSVALFWSIETAIYVIPAWLFFVLYFYYQQNHFFIKNIFKAYTFFSISVLSLLAIISFYEYTLTKQLPNFKNYIQFALTYKDGFSSELIPLIGNHYIAIIILLSGLLVSNYFLHKKHYDVLTSALAYISIQNIALFSYFISRSNQNNIINIAPFLLLEFFIIYKVIKNNFKINLYPYLSVPILIFIVFFSTRCFQNIYDNPNKVVRPTQKPPFAIQNYDSIKNKYNFTSNNVLIISKDYDSPIIIDNHIHTQLPLNPCLMTVLLPNYKEKYILPNLNKVEIGTTLVTTSDMPELTNMIKQKFTLNPVATKSAGMFDIYTLTK